MQFQIQQIYKNLQSRLLFLPLSAAPLYKLPLSVRYKNEIIITTEGNWLLTESDAEDGILNLVSAHCQIPHGQIYERVKFE
ncbi:hypothetical protein NIES4075_45340 [Tolypothrix sp. NIES-4075]|uniref:hypothetical protein n=1 Tax=Tolypothrix sp. NIES-4075 TaxID=2005459 RepID=UPI000B5C39D8|nr:hypothetical protein [Tolypothrix sp. NIES-4075]GAX43519.1 hypothetical protein NIES4075_45340 [Tolypothrix sp. NIES-4075]